MDFSDIFEYLKMVNVDLPVQNSENERQVDDDAGPDQEEVKLSEMDIKCREADIEYWTAEMQMENERREQLMELFDIMTNE